MSQGIDTPERVPGRAVWTAVLAAVLPPLLAAWWIWRQRDELPSRVAQHWNAAGQPDGWASATGVVLFTALFPIGMALLLLALGWGLHAWRSMAVTAAGMGTFIASLMVFLVLGQRGLPEGAAPAMPQWVMFPSTALAALVAALVWFVMRRHGPVPTAQTAVPEGADLLQADEHALIAWSGHTRRSRGAAALVVVFGALPVVVILLVAAVNRQWGMAVFLLLPLALVAVMGSFVSSDVTIDRRGVRARGMGVVPLLTVPIDTITSADVVATFSSLGQTGGYGYRVAADGTRYLATGDGEALRIHRQGQPAVLITIDDAARAAATLNTLVTRRSDAARAGGI